MEYLAEQGPTCGRPFVNTISQSRHKNMKELRPREKSRAKNIRIVFGFDPHRHAIFLVAGDKTSQWDKWYSKHIPEQMKDLATTSNNSRKATNSYLLRENPLIETGTTHPQSLRRTP
nr:type II toxin-antitoxin system RelE/ParE family toxin [Corynebacterium glutamicum]